MARPRSLVTAYDIMFEICKIIDRYRDDNYHNSSRYLAEIKKIIR